MIMMMKNFYLYLLVIAISGMVFYLPSISNPFVWDDVVIIRDNPFIGGDLRISPRHLITVDYFGISREGSYRPIATLLYYWTGRLGGKNPAIYRAVNIVFHIVASVLAACLVWKILGSGLSGFMCGLLFALHPVHSETIFIVSFNEDILMAVFVMAAFMAYLNYRQKGRMISLALSILFYLMGCFSKEPSLIVLPAMVAFYEIFYLRHNTPSYDANNEFLARGKFALYALCVLAAALIYLSLRILVSPRMALPLAAINWKEVVWNLFTKGLASLWEYFRISAVMPFDLSADRTLSFGLFHSIAGLAVLIWLVYAGFFKYRKEMGLWVVIFIVPLLPVLNIIPFYYYPVVAERYLYLPSVGVCAVIGGWVDRCSAYSADRKMRMLLVYSILFLFAVSIVERGSDYRDSFVFWQRAVESSPRSFIARLSLGNEYIRKGDTASAEFQFNKALELKPDYAEAYVNLGSLYGFRRDYEKAISFFNKAIKINPFLAKGYSGLGVMYLEQNNYDKAEDFFSKALELDGTLVGVYHYLADIYERKNRPGRALDMYQRVISGFAPDDIRALNKAGMLASALGRYEEAERYFKKVVSISGGKSADALVNLGNVYFMKKNYILARDCYRKALGLSDGPLLAVANSNLKITEDKIKSTSR